MVALCVSQSEEDIWGARGGPGPDTNLNSRGMGTIETDQ